MNILYEFILENTLNIFELRTYTLHVGKLSKAIQVYEELGWPALKKYKKNIVRYYIGDIGALNQIIHVWQFEDDNSRRETWKKIFADEDFIKFASEFRPLVLTQENRPTTKQTHLQVLYTIHKDTKHALARG